MGNGNVTPHCYTPDQEISLSSEMFRMRRRVCRSNNQCEETQDTPISRMTSHTATLLVANNSDIESVKFRTAECGLWLISSFSQN